MGDGPVVRGDIGGANDSWNAGLDVLAQTPAPQSPVDADRKALARRLQDLATQACKQVAVKDDYAFATRARQYGEILVACAARHTAPKASK